jgi:hypothetical protein
MSGDKSLLASDIGLIGSDCVSQTFKIVDACSSPPITECGKFLLRSKTDSKFLYTYQGHIDTTTSIDDATKYTLDGTALAADGLVWNVFDEGTSSTIYPGAKSGSSAMTCTVTDNTLSCGRTLEFCPSSPGVLMASREGLDSGCTEHVFEFVDAACRPPPIPPTCGRFLLQSQQDPTLFLRTVSGADKAMLVESSSKEKATAFELDGTKMVDSTGHWQGYGDGRDFVYSVLPSHATDLGDYWDLKCGVTSENKFACQGRDNLHSELAFCSGSNESPTNLVVDSPDLIEEACPGRVQQTFQYVDACPPSCVHGSAIQGTGSYGFNYIIACAFTFSGSPFDKVSNVADLAACVQLADNISGANFAQYDTETSTCSFYRRPAAPKQNFSGLTPIASRAPDICSGVACKLPECGDFVLRSTEDSTYLANDADSSGYISAVASIDSATTYKFNADGWIVASDDSQVWRRIADNPNKAVFWAALPDSTEMSCSVNGAGEFSCGVPLYFCPLEGQSRLYASEEQPIPSDCTAQTFEFVDSCGPPKPVSRLRFMLPPFSFH